MNKPIWDIPLANPLMFALVMKNKTVCSLFIEALLGIQIRDLTYIETEKDMSDLHYYHGVRLDVYAEDEFNTIYNIEMQVVKQTDLPKRIRYYQSQIDRHTLERSSDYNKLKKSVVIFVCDYDPFGLRYPVYVRKSALCDYMSEALNTHPYDDGSSVFVLNTHYAAPFRDGSCADRYQAILEFLDLVQKHGTLKPEDFGTSLCQEVVRTQNDVKQDQEKEGALMTVQNWVNEEAIAARQEGREEGRREGREEGLKEGAVRFGKLTSILLDANRIDDLKRATANPDFTERLYKEFGL